MYILHNDWLVTGLLQYDDESESYILDCTMEDVIDGAMLWKYHSGDFEGCGKPSEDPDDFGVWIDGEWYEDESYREEEDEDDEEEKEMSKKDLFEIMINDWLADNADEMSDLDVGEPYQNENGEWIADAEDEKCCYEVRDDGDGNIVIVYCGTK